ncbi:Alcohol dehydrogenase 1 [Exophiala dermatitidis]
MAIEGVPEQMLAVQIVEFNKPYKIHKLPTPTELKEHEMLLKTVVASLCHTDSMVVEGKFPTKLPCVASHEGTGIVKAVGSKVTNFKIGDRVMSGVPKNQCGMCYSCRGPNDWHQYCENAEGHIGVFIDGAFAEYHVVDSRTSCHIPDKVSFASAAPLACAGCTIYRALIVSEVKKGDWIAIVGAGGGLGHLGIQFAIAKGINVVAIDARDEALELCQKAGAKHIFDAREGQDKIVENVQALTDGLGVHAAINVSEHSTAADTACSVTRMHGTMVQVAQPERVCVAFQHLIFRDIRIKGTLIAGQDYSQQMLDDVARYGIKVETNLFYGLEEVPKMVELAHSGKMKGKAVCVVDRAEFEKEKGTI